MDITSYIPERKERPVVRPVKRQKCRPERNRK